MKKQILLAFVLLMTITLSAHDLDRSSSLRMGVNTISASDSIRINNYLQRQRSSRSLLATAGLSILGGLVNDASSILITEVMKVANIRSNQREEWEEMIDNENYYMDSLSYLNGLTDFYSEGSYDGPLDPANLKFNGFTLLSKRLGNDVLKFYCHVATDEAGLNQIFNHSKFNLVLDSMYFSPYNCHLPNLAANYIYPDEDKEYDRNLEFSFDDRENLMVSLYFSFSSSWYNEAVMLARNVDLGTFKVQIPIDEEMLEDGMFVYKRETIDANREYYQAHREQFDPDSPQYDETLEMPDTTYLSISGDCFIVPRSYMPLPGGIAHWGTGEYNVRLCIVEQCNITDNMRENWHHDYRQITRMKKENKVGNYLVNLYQQNGITMVKTILENASESAIQTLGF